MVRVGDKIRVTNNEGNERYFHVGDVGTVTWLRGGDITADFNNNGNSSAYEGGVWYVPRNHYVVIGDTAGYREVKRKAKVGERVKITGNGHPVYHSLEIGSVGEITSFSVSGRTVATVDDVGQIIDENDYVVLEPITESTVDSRIASLEQRVAALEAKLTVKDDAPKPTVANVSTREQIIGKAKKDVQGLLRRMHDGKNATDGNNWWNSYMTKADFIVDRKKRTVVTLLRYYIGNSDEVLERGIAHCAPDDCFNVHIGKAISLRRALGLDVPDEYTHAPKPKEVNVGDRVTWSHLQGKTEYYVTRLDGKFYNDADLRIIKSSSGVSGNAFARGDFSGAIILDDSHDFGGEQA